MTAADQNILQRRLIRLKSLTPVGKMQQRAVQRDIRKVERELTGLKPLGRPVVEAKPKKKVNRVDWSKVAKAASKL